MKRDFRHLDEIPDVEWAYVAGFFDGEGCVLITRRKRSLRRSLAISIGQSKHGVMYWLEQKLGGTVHLIEAEKLPRRKDGSLARQMWRWSAHGRLAEAILKKMYPFLKVKHAEADCGIEFQKVLGWHQRDLSKGTLLKLDEISDELKVTRECDQ